ncbi:MAG: DUF3795 domain-containing protein [Clostridiales bacterium]|nr:DUF3795 domain-containing protein [Clostridiales bacterium]
MEYLAREYPLFSACGLNCGLCPRYYTAGPSRCPGCAGSGFSALHPSCGVLSCCGRKGLEYCFLCAEFPCKKYTGADLSDSFITHKNQFKDMQKAKREGLEAYKAGLEEKAGALAALLKGYDDGRKKGFFCLAVNLLELEDINTLLARLMDETGPEATLKAKAAAATRLMEELAEKRGVLLKLRKKSKAQQ